jgi:DNA-binding LacI/PurR family transcriptional regulator
VPEDLSVVGFDDSPLAERIRPTLTTVRQDVVAKGRVAVAALTAEIARASGNAAAEDSSPAEDSSSSDDEVLLPTELVIRGSTAAPPPGRG